ncbi:BACON domain-containing protein [Pedobacter heparinus]|uniref:BACON domain-containing protein n=1 Tax=Pedobacter heparinus TaxID=984 RepID=UPI0029316F18|nr:BACON domain-containing carbohydrate-binding protein [Pedobacter heparinus]
MKRTLIFCLTIMVIVLTNCSKDNNETPSKPTLTIERDVYEYLNTDLTGNFAVSISDNSEWTVETLSTAPWFGVVKKDNQVSFTMEENSALYERVAKVKVVSADKQLSKIVVIKQHGNTPTIILDKTLLKLLNPADNGIVTINSNMQWSLSSNADWLTWEINGKDVKIMATANPLDGERNAVITVNAESPIFNKAITVTQKGTVEFDINTKNVQFTKDGGSFTLDIQTNQNWTYAVLEKTPWYTLQRDGGKLTITTPKNNFMPLTGTINITYGLLNVAVSVKQDGIQTGNELDRQVLIALYETMGGAGWTGTKWDITAPLTVDNAATKWSGVTVANVNGVARVRELKFGGKNLKGPIPSAIGFLSEVTTIDFNNNNQQITGMIPPSMGNLSNLLNLTLSRSGLTGTIPVEFERLTKLTLLQMHTSNFIGPIPSGVFGKMPNLNSVELKLNNFTGNLPADFLSHPNFSKWNVSANTCPQNAGFGFTKCP